MRKTIMVLMCILLAMTCAAAMAENAGKEDYTVVTVNGAFSIRGITPEGYRVLAEAVCAFLRGQKTEN